MTLTKGLIWTSQTEIGGIPYHTAFVAETDLQIESLIGMLVIYIAKKDQSLSVVYLYTCELNDHSIVSRISDNDR